MRSTKLCLLALAGSLLAVGTATANDEPDTPWGHSSHGSEYDAGPRQKPWKMEGIGAVSFPVSTSNPEVQEWFDQGMTLLHNFWWYEAERTFRWCLKLDPDCAMAYWGLSIATGRDRAKDRSEAFLEEAVARTGDVTERERRFIEFTAASEAIEESADDVSEQRSKTIELYDRLIMDFPDDIEAKALYWLLAGEAMGRQPMGLARYAMESVLDDVLEVDPNHVGALHYRIHNWDGKDGHFAVDSCMKLGDIAPGSGHLLHMPGHVLSGVGLWHEAAIAMDRATRVEKAYMNQRMILPEQNWDYAHNLDYLCYIQEQLGMVEQALLGAEQMQKAPAFSNNPMFASLTVFPTIRALVKYQRWDELLEPGRIKLSLDNPRMEQMWLGIQARAQIGAGLLDEAEESLESLKKKMEEAAKKRGDSGPPPTGDDAFFARMMQARLDQQTKSLEGLLAIARGDRLHGLTLLTQAAQAQEMVWSNDPPHDGEYLYNTLGDHYLELGAPQLAADCYEKTLETIFHDGFALAGLVVAHHQLGDLEAARAAMAKLKVVWSDADRPNRWLAAAEATGVDAEPHLDGPIEQRNYKSEILDVHGPSLWIPSELPELLATNAAGAEVKLADYRGQNVLLIFYLGEECVHCIEQLQKAEERLDALKDLDTVVLAVSRDEVSEIAEQQSDFGVQLLSDPTFANARRFQSYDDFEEIELHSTFLINRQGRLHWSRIGGEPFTDFDYLEDELDRMNRFAEPKVAGGAEATEAVAEESAGEE